MRRAILAAAVLLAMPLAGCLGGSDDGVQEPAQVQSLPPAKIGEEGRPGRVAGVVTDLALQPIAGAEVRLLEHDRTTTTRADGAYVIKNLTPAAYLVRVEAADFIGQTFQVEVFRDQTTILDAVLPPVPSASPFHETSELQGFMSCRLSAEAGEGNEQFGTGCPIPDENDRSTFEVPVGADPKRVLVELIWDANTEAAQEMDVTVRTAMRGDQQDTLGEGHGPSVLQLSVPGSALERFYPEGGVVRIDVGVHPSTGDHEGVLLGGAVQQEFTLIVTTFYVDPGPNDFTAIGS